MEAIYIPKIVGGVPARLIEALQAPPLAQMLHLLRLAQTPPERLAAALKQVFPGHVDEFAEDVIAKAIVALRAGANDHTTDGSDPSDLKRPEFKELTRERTEVQLKVRVMPISKYAPELTGKFTDVALIDKLRVTRAFTGFSRIKSAGSSAAVDMRQLRRTVPSDHERWLPASVVFGEGVLLRLDADRLSAWEGRANVIARAARLQARHDRAISAGHLEPREISPRFVLLHTLAHALIQRLAFESGYSAASIAERIYSSAEGEMAGVLLYTAAGDAEGTLGGLVRLGGIGRLEPVLRRALERANGAPPIRSVWNWVRAGDRVQAPVTARPATTALCFPKLRAKSSIAI